MIELVPELIVSVYNVFVLVKLLSRVPELNVNKDSVASLDSTMAALVITTLYVRIVVPSCAVTAI